MSLDIMLAIAVLVLFVIVWVLSSRVSRLNDALNRNYAQLADKTDSDDHKRTKQKLERLEEKYDFLNKDMWALEDKVLNDINNVRLECESNNNTVYDRLDSLADTLGYKIEDTPNHYKVTIKK
jgi:predicted Holliday junction resolvase-like endonuclease